MDDMLDDFLNTLKSNKSLKISMPSQANKKHTADDTSLLDRELSSHCVKKCNIESERNYIKHFRLKDDEEYLKVI